MEERFGIRTALPKCAAKVDGGIHLNKRNVEVWADKRGRERNLRG